MASAAYFWTGRWGCIEEAIVCEVTEQENHWHEYLRIKAGDPL